MDKPKVVVPESKEKILKQIEALEWQIKQDKNQKDKEIHEEALRGLRLQLNKFK